MNSLVLLDTSAWIISFKKGVSLRFKEEVERLLAENKVVITPLIILEILNGVKTQKDFDELLKDLNVLECVSVTDNVWHSAYRITFNLRRRGLAVPLIDVLIAGICLKHNFLLMHSDRHFEFIKKYYPLNTKYIQYKS